MKNIDSKKDTDEFEKPLWLSSKKLAESMGMNGVEEKKASDGSGRAQELFNNPLIADDLKRLNITLEMVKKNVWIVNQYLINRMDYEAIKNNEKALAFFHRGQIEISGTTLFYSVDQSQKDIDEALKKNCYPFADYPEKFQEILNTDVKSVYRGQHEYFQALKKLSTHLEMDKNWIYCYGDFRSGKTFITVAFINTLFKEHPGMKVAFVSASNTFNNLANLVTTDSYSFQRDFDTIANVDVLAIDDLGNERINQFVIENVTLPLLKYRAERDLPTIILSDSDLDTLRAVYRSSSGGTSSKRSSQLISFISGKIDKPIKIQQN